MRLRKLIIPGLQLRLSVWFGCIAAIALGVQFILVSGAMSEVALKLPGDAAKNFDLVSEAYNEVFFLSLGIVLPLALMTGILATFRIAGPVYGLATFFKAVLKGDQTSICMLRKGDEMKELCDLANEVTLPMREANKAKADDSQDRLRKVA